MGRGTSLATRGLRSEVPSPGRGVDGLRLIIIAVLGFSFVLPVAAVISLALNPDALAHVVTRDVAIAAKNSAVTAGASAVFATVIGAVLVLVLDRSDIWGRRGLRMLFLSPFLVPPFIGAIAWIGLLGPNGTLRELLDKLFGLAELPFSIYGAGGIIALLTIHSYPIAYIIISAAMKRIPASLEEASLIAGAPQARTMVSITMPLLRPTLVAAFTLCAVSNLSDFGIPALLGLQVNYYTLSTLIYRFLVAGVVDDPLGVSSSIGLALLVIAVGAVMLQRRISGTIRLDPTGERVGTVQTGALRAPFSLIAWLGAITFALLPLLSLAQESLRPAPGVPLTWKSATLDNFVAVAHYPGAVSGVVNSVTLSVGAALICGVLGLIIGTLITRTRARTNLFLDIASTLPQSMPGLVIGIGWIIAGIWISVYGTPWVLLFAYVTAFVALVVQAVRGPLSDTDPALEEAAQISGAGGLRSFLDVTWRAALPAALSGMVLVALTAVRELTISVLLASPGNRTLGVVIFDLQQSGSYSTAASLALLVTIVGLLGLGLVAGSTRSD